MALATTALAAVAILESVFYIIIKKKILKYTVSNTRYMSLPKENKITRLSSWLCYRIILPGLQLLRKLMTYFTNVSMVKVEDRIKISEPKSLDFPSSLLDVLQVHLTS